MGVGGTKFFNGFIPSRSPKSSESFFSHIPPTHLHRGNSNNSTDPNLSALNPVFPAIDSQIPQQTRNRNLTTLPKELDRDYLMELFDACKQ